MTIPSTRFRQGNIDPQRWDRLKTILGQALEQDSSAARISLVERCCGNDTDLLKEAESLLIEAEALLKEPTDRFEDCARNAASIFWHDTPPRGGQRVGAYVIIRELGRGGMGTVFLAERADGRFEKSVAIKILNPGSDTAEILRRFRAERQILAGLDHPNISRLLDAGTTDDGLPYFIMDYIVGAPVTRFVVRRNLSTRQRLELFLKICAAVEFAHRNRVVHRDIKPNNILVNAEGEPKLLDFGIAKLLANDEDRARWTTLAQQRLTPVSASPEQAKGDPVTISTDIYSLGALLYELLSDQKPHRFSTTHPTREELALVVGEQVPPPPSALASDAHSGRRLRGDLDAIVLCAMRKDPEKRYATVADFAVDIRRYLTGRPIVARRPTFAYRAKCLLRRNGSRLATLAAVMSLIAGVLFASWARRSREAAGVSTPGSDISSIAILPFENLGNDDSQSYLAGAIQDNILTDLGKVRDLKVISRSGVTAYRSRNRNMKQIGRDLGVANVLEGSVQVGGNRIRINAQLVDTRTDSQIWAEHYDRNVNDIFALQSELAQTIAAQLKTTLSAGEKAEIWKQPTQDLQAYDLYLRARAALFAAGRTIPHESANIAIGLLNRAIERDPNFTLAYCLLSEAHILEYRFGHDHSPRNFAAAKEAAETALRLEPNREEARVALAQYYYHGLRDYRRANQELVRSSGPHAVEFFILASLVERRLGRFAASIRDGEKAIELDPQNVSLVVSVVQTYSGLRRFDDAERVANAALARLAGAKPLGLLRVKSEAALGRGNLEQARAVLDSIEKKEDIDYLGARLWLYLLERDCSGAKIFSAKAPNEMKRGANFWFILATLAHLEGEVSEERQAYIEAKRLTQLALEAQPDDPILLGDLALAEAGLGKSEEALRYARRACEMLPTSVDAVAGPALEMRLAEVLAVIGDRENALDKLSELANQPLSQINYGDLKLNPMWDDLRNDPRYARILAQSALPLGHND